MARKPSNWSHRPAAEANSYRDPVSRVSEVIRFHPDVPPQNPRETRVIWTAPGSLPSAVRQLHVAWSGLASVARLSDVRGPWAALLWDAESARYCLASDSIGVQPLFWAKSDDGEVVAASWLAQLMGQPDVSADLDHEGILLEALPLVSGEAVQHRTHFLQVQRVPWGRVRIFESSGRGRDVKYWDPTDIEEIDCSVPEASALLREAIHRAVERSLDDGAPAGAHVSGGLDCSAVALKAQEILRSDGRTLVAGYSWAPSPETFEYVTNDERPRVLAVAAAAGVPMRWVDDNDLGDWYFQRDVNLYPHSTHRWERSVLPQAKQDGVTVMLSGWGGDELASFNGRTVLSDLVLHGRLVEAWRVAGANPLQGHGVQRFIGARNLLRGTAHALSGRGRFSRSRAALDRAEGLVRPVSPLAADMLVAGWERQRGLKTVRSTQLELLTNGHLQERTVAWYQTGRLFDVTYRYPLLDPDVVTTAIALPPRAFRSADWTRVAFRQAVEPWTPSDVVWHGPKFEPAMLHPQSPRRIRSPKRPGGADQESMEMLALAARVTQVLVDADR